VAKLKKKAAKSTAATTAEKPPKVDPLVGKTFTFTRDGKAYFGKVESRVSPTSFLVRLLPDGYGYVLSASHMAKLDVVFEPDK
jgi:hypothetical protein